MRLQGRRALERLCTVIAIAVLQISLVLGQAWLIWLGRRTCWATPRVNIASMSFQSISRGKDLVAMATNAVSCCPLMLTKGVSVFERFDANIARVIHFESKLSTFK